MSVLPLHKPASDKDYYLGMFLGGVYQETMGSAHNMLGSTHVVQVRVVPGSQPHFGNRSPHPVVLCFTLL